MEGVRVCEEGEEMGGVCVWEGCEERLDSVRGEKGNQK